MEYFDFLNTEYIFVLNNLANGGAQENIQGPPIFYYCMQLVY